MPGDDKPQSTSARVDEIVSIFIPRIRRKQSHVEYIIEVTGKTAVWNIYRRYQQFRDLHSSLARLGGITDNYHTPKGVLPVLPGTSWIKVTSDDVDLVEKRRLHLEIYLQQLLVPSNKFYRDQPELRQFLHQDEMPLSYKNTLSRSVPGINAPLENEPSGSVERVFYDETEEDTRHVAVIASLPTDAVESAIAPEIPKMDDWSSSARSHNEIAAIAGGFTAQTRIVNDKSETVVSGQQPNGSNFDCSVPHEICKACGQREEVDYDFDEWVSHGTCRHCGQLTEHELVIPRLANNSNYNNDDSQLSPCSPDSNSNNNNNDNRNNNRKKHSSNNNGDDDDDDDEFDHLDDHTSGKSPASPGTKDSKAPQTEEEYRAAARRRAELAGVPVDSLGNNNNNNNSTTASSANGAPKSPRTPTALDNSHSNNSNNNSNANQNQQQQSQPASPDVPKDETIVQATKTFDARCDISLSDFELITTLGRGTFGKVMKARFKNNGQIYAIKVLSKSMVHQKRMVDYVKEEKGIMAFLPPHPFVVQLHFAFQTDHHLYFVMDFLTGGELYAHMQPLERLPLHAARFYAAELLLAIEHVHRYDVCHRDLKPENVVLAADGHIKLMDFGLARKAFSHKRRFSFVGSAEYLSPEVVRTEGQTKAIDWWGFGCMVYEFLTGKTPFHANTAREVYASILNRQVDYNRPGMTSEGQDLIQKLLEKNPRTRLQDASKMKRHPFFAGINWDLVVQKKLKPPFVPDLTSNDTKYFSKEFTSEWATIPAAANATRGSIERLAQRFSNFRRIADQHPGDRAASAALNQQLQQQLLADAAHSNAAASGGGKRSSGVGGGQDGSSTPRSEGQTPRGSELGVTATPKPSKAQNHTSQRISTLYGRPLPSTEQLLPLISLHLCETVASGTNGKIPSSPDSLMKHIDPDEFVGVWRLLRVEMTSTLGQVVFPWGAEVAGQLIFTRNGLFSCQICPIKRIKFRGISKPTRDEMVEAFNSYVAAFGNFFVVPGKPFIVQRATAALSPSLIGVLQKRYFDLDSERKLLKLMSPFYRGEGGTLVFSSTTWSKVA